MQDKQVYSRWELLFEVPHAPAEVAPSYIQYPVRDIAQEAEIDKGTVMQWFREVCSATLIRTGIKLGGPGKVVQIVESLFCHKTKVSK